MTEPVFHATPQGADAVVRRGNLRRARSGAAAGAAAGLVVGVALLAPWQGPGARDSLVPADDPTSTPTPTVVALPRATRPPVVIPAPAVPSLPTAPATATTRPSAPPPATAPTPSPAARRSSPITRGTSTIADDDLCSDGSTVASGWCLRYTGPSTARRGTPVRLSAALCRITSFGAATITFGDTREIQLEVDGTGWQAGQGERYTSPGRTVTVEGGHCLTWASTWDTRDADGFLVVPGSYTIGLGVSGSVGIASSQGDALTVTD